MAVSAKIKKMMEDSSWIRKMFETGAELKARHGADKVFDFSIGNPNLEPPSRFADTVISKIRETAPGKHGYMPNAGYPAVREKVAAYVSEEQGSAIAGSHVLMTCGAGGAMNVVLKALLNPGDSVIVSAPYFVEYGSYVDNHGGRLKVVPSKDNFDIDPQAIGAAVDESTAAVIINSPNNPTGRIYPAALLRELGQVLRRRSREVGRPVYLLSDEPYRKIAFDGLPVPPVFPAYENSLILTSYSKDLSIPGERIGWLALNPLAADARELLDGMTLANRILGFVNAPGLMQRVVGDLQGVSADIALYERKRNLFCDGLAAIGYNFIRPQGTFYIFPKAPGGDDAAFVRLLQEELILAVPGRGFGAPGYFRLSFCVSDRTITDSLAGFRRVWERTE